LGGGSGEELQNEAILGWHLEGGPKGCYSAVGLGTSNRPGAAFPYLFSTRSYTIHKHPLMRTRKTTFNYDAQTFTIFDGSTRLFITYFLAILRRQPFSSGTTLVIHGLTMKELTIQSFMCQIKDIAADHYSEASGSFVMYARKELHKS
jgi:hypothetical protein